MSFIALRIEFIVPADPLTWEERMERGIQRLEQLTGTSLHYNAMVHPPRKIPRRSTMLKQCLKKRWRQFSLSNGVDSALEGTKYANFDFVEMGGVIEDHAPDVYFVDIFMRFERPDFVIELMREVGSAMQCFTAQIIPQAVENALNRYYMGEGGTVYHKELAAHIVSGLSKCDTPLPALNPRTGNYFVDARLPLSLGWINYWSASTCAYLNFPDAERDAALLRHSFPIAEGAWIVRLSEEILDLHELDHLRIYTETYARIISGSNSGVLELDKEIEAHFPCRAMLVKFDAVEAVAEAIGALANAESGMVIRDDRGDSASTVLQLTAGPSEWIRLELDDARFFCTAAKRSLSRVLFSYVRRSGAKGSV